jgi:isopenicillin-N N-acyltransferase-like protein
MATRVLPLYEVRGNARERGRQQGDAAREQVEASLAQYRELLPHATGLNWDEALVETRKFLPYGEVAFPGFVEELRGIAEGADISFLEVWALNCYEGLMQPEQAWGCTSVAVSGDLTGNGHVFLAHNEDWQSEDADHVYLVRSIPDEGPSFLAMTYGPLLANIGLNACGLAVAIDSVYPTDVRAGVPRILCARAILAARTIGEAIRACVPKSRAGGYNHLLADASGELYNVETSAATHEIEYGQSGWLAHSNHYLSPKMQALEEPGVYAGSNVRVNRARRLMAAQVGSVTVESLQTLLRDHVNWPDAICSHEDSGDPVHERTQTVASLVMDLTAQVMWAAPGPPCQNDFVPFPLLAGGPKAGAALCRKPTC